MRAHLLRFAAIAIVLAVPHVVSAQSRVPADVGERIRILVSTDQGSDVYIGRVAAIGRDSLIVQDSTNVLHVVASARITRLAMSRGPETHTVMGAGLGAALGSTIAQLHMLATYHPRDCDDSLVVVSCLGDSIRDVLRRAAVVGLIGGVTGAAVGAWFGSRSRTEYWIDRPLGRTTLRVLPTASGSGVSVSLRF